MSKRLEERNDGLHADFLSSIADIAKSDWDRLADPVNRPFNPFVSHDFLNLLEESGTLCPETGWQPHHLVLRDGDKAVAAMPLYFKSHSQGEYVFDHSWADAYERAGGHYYPKLLSAAPFTPVSGPRLLAPREDLCRLLAHTARSHCETLGLSSLHINFITPAEKDLLTHEGFLIRTGLQYHWFNEQYQNFDDFTATLTARKRKSLRRERRTVRDHGLEIELVQGKDIREHHLDHFWAFYQDTGARKWGHPYLTRQAFSLLAERMGAHLLFIFARHQGEYIAGAMNMIGSDSLYGRYWGCRQPIPHLHFELCYYQAIDYAIAHGLNRVEAGAQGEHKLGRGYKPVETWSAHHITHEGLREAVGHFVRQEQSAIAHEAEILSTYTPFKKGNQR